MAPSIAENRSLSSPSGDKFKVIVVGAGIAGLLTAIGLRLDDHSGTILEQASTFSEVGAGLRIPPNSFKILHRWGIDLTYMKKTYSNGNRFLRYDTGRIVADMSHGIPEWDFGGSYLKVHRADYHDVLLRKAVEVGVDIRLYARFDNVEECKLAQFGCEVCELRHWVCHAHAMMSARSVSTEVIVRDKVKYYLLQGLTRYPLLA